MLINREELAWAAGFFDGEGYVGLLAGRTLRLHIPQTDPRPLERFKTAIYLGVIDGPRYSNNPRHSPQWVWRVSGFANVQAVIAQLWIFLSEPKRDQARLALNTYLAKRHRGGALCARGHRDWVLDKAGHRRCRICSIVEPNARKIRNYHVLHPNARYNPYPLNRNPRSEGGPNLHAE